MSDVVRIGGPTAEDSVLRNVQKNAGTAEEESLVAQMPHDRVRAALALWTAGATYGDIATQLQLKSPAVAMLAIERALSEQVDDNMDRTKLRRRMSLTLDRFLKAVTPKAIDPNHPEQLAAVRAALAIVDRYSKLNGLDAPVEVNVNMPGSDEFQRFVELAALGAGMEVPIEADVFDFEDAEVVDDDDDTGRD